MKRVVYIMAIIMAVACSSPREAVTAEGLPPVWPDYSGVTVPATVAPLNFSAVPDGVTLSASVKDDSGNELISARGRTVRFPLRRWHKALEANVGKALSITVSVRQDGSWRTYSPFEIYVSGDEIDYGLTYRLVLPGYQAFGHMGMYERDLSSFRQKELIDNRMLESGCVNCHTARQTDPSDFSLHVRGAHSATYLRHNGEELALDTKTDSTGGFFVYPGWHPSGRYIAYSVNTTRQEFYTAMEKRIEVYDENSDVIVYDADNNKVLIPSALRRKDRFETYPCFSADGRTLYFCSSEAESSMPEQVGETRYSLCSIDFDPESGTFGDEITTVVDAVAAGKSFATPRASYDGKYILFAAADFGTFPIWHKEADLWLYDIASGTVRQAAELNSDDVESFHNWSSNSSWVVLSSRRDDGLYTKLYIAHMNPDGSFGKPFLLPQKNPARFYSETVYSFNTPDFTLSEVNLNTRATSRRILASNRERVLLVTKNPTK